MLKGGIFMDKTQFLISKIFTIPYFDRLIEENNVPDSFQKCITRYVKDDQDLTYGKVISRIYSYMDNEYRNEYYYKNTLFNNLLLQKHSLLETAALTELPIANSKADFVMINGKGIVYEIKTDLDNLQRLESQIIDYYKVFKYVNVVVSKKQLGKVKEFLQETKVGIYELTDSKKFICRKKPYSNKDGLSYQALFQMLRKKEFESILMEYYGKLPEVNDFDYYREALRLIEKKISINKFQELVMIALKRRTILQEEDVFKNKVPEELSFYVYFSKKNRTNYKLVNEFLKKTVGV